MFHFDACQDTFHRSFASFLIAICFSCECFSSLSRLPPPQNPKQYFTNKDPDNLSMSGSYNDNGDGLTEWYQSTPGVECYVGDKALKIDREAKTVISESGRVGCFLL